VRVDGIGAESVPIALAIDDVRIATTMTNTDGVFNRTVEFPASVPPGSNRLNVWVPLEDRALAPESASTPISVERSQTQLTADAQRIQGGARISGKLFTQDGHPVADHTVTLSIDKTVVAYVTTDDNGTYSNSFSASTLESRGIELAGRSTLDVQASFAGDQTNLESATGQATVRLEPRSDRVLLFGLLQGTGLGTEGNSLASRYLGIAVDLQESRLSATVLAVARRFPGVAAFGALLGLLAMWRGMARVPRLLDFLSRAWRSVADRRHVFGPDGGRTSDSLDDPDTGPTAVPAEDPESSSPLAAADVDSVGSATLATARAHADAGRTDDAVLTAYTAVHRHLRSSQADTATTPREFSRVYEEVLRDSHVEALRRLTDAYERAAFSQTPVQASAADHVLTAARELLEYDVIPPDIELRSDGES
jgi:hypothetical protein